VGDLEDQWLNTGPKLGDVLEKLRETRRLPEQADFRNYKQGWLDMFTRLIDPHEDMLYLPDGTALRMLIMPHPAGGLMMTFEDVTSNLELESSYNTLIAVQRETLDNLAVSSFDKKQIDGMKEKLISHGIERNVQEGRVQLSNNSLLEYNTMPLPDGGVLMSLTAYKLKMLYVKKMPLLKRQSV